MKKTLGKSSLGLGALLLAALLGAVALFLYAALFGGTWPPFFWAATLSLFLIIIIKLLALGLLDEERQALASAMLWELLSGAIGWTWMILAMATVIVFFRTLFFDGHWSDFFGILVGSATCKLFTRAAIWYKEVAMLKREVLSKET
jgi:hypothetical protein